MVEILTVDENNGTFHEGFGGHNPSLKKITPSGPLRRVGRGANLILLSVN